MISPHRRVPARRAPLALLLLAALLPSVASAIEVPRDVRGVETAQSTVEWSWGAVPGAVRYELTLDGIDIVETTETRYVSSGLWWGDHSLTVKAIGADGGVSEQSATGKIRVRRTFSASEPNVATRGGWIRGNPVAGGGSAQSSAPSAGAGIRDASFSVAADDGDTLIDPSSWAQPNIDRPGYELVFSDEFDGSSLNPYRWNGQLRWDGEFNGERFEYRLINGEHQFYVNPISNDPEHLSSVANVYNPFEFNGSRLAIRAKRNPLKTRNGGRSYGALRDMVSQQDFLSGAISTYDKFAQKYGYFEARIKIPSHVGTFPAFWLYHQKRKTEGTQRTEIDIMENLGHFTQYVYNSFHYFTDVRPGRSGNPHFLKPQPSGQIYTGTDYSQNYHTYAVEWEPGKVTWLIDGQVVSELYNDNVNHEELYIIINLAMGGNWTNFPTNAGGLGRSRGNYFPNAEDLANFADPALEIDYVRVYRRR